MSGLEIIELKHSPTEPSSPIEVIVRHSGIESRIIGNPESVLRELISYFSKTYPSIERSTGTVAGRLSELCNEQLVERVGKGSYRLTTMGTRVIMKDLMLRVSQLPDR